MNATATATQTLKCRNCGEVWERPAERGRPPVYCDNCRKLGAALGPRPTHAPEVHVKPVGGTHYAFSTLLEVVQSRCHAMLVGPAGSGKSTAGRQVGKALDLEFRTESCNPQMSKFDIMGYMDAKGEYVKGVMYDAFKNGGVILMDEIDASNPAVLTAINLLASVEIGETVTFPNGENVARHADFILIAGANTYGDGASEQYVGREQLDAATLDRFEMIEWGYDEALEFVAAGPDAFEWVTFVQAVRAAAKRANVEMLITPRASIQGAKMLRQGMKRQTVENLRIWRGVSEDAKRTVQAEMRRAS